MRTEYNDQTAGVIPMDKRVRGFKPVENKKQGRLCAALLRVKNYFCKPGMFSRVLVVFCILYVLRVTEWAMRQFEMSNMEATTLLTVTVGFFGTELALLCLKRVFAKKDNKEASEACNKLAD